VHEAQHGLGQRVLAVRVVRDGRDVVRDFSNQLATLLQGAHDEAILRGSLIVFEIKTDRYRFMQVDAEGKLAAITDGEFAQMSFPQHVEASLELDSQDTSNGNKRRVVVFDPSGATPPFRVSLIMRKTRWWIIGESGGRIRTAPTLDEPKA
jgi:hypothetical protein